MMKSFEYESEKLMQEQLLAREFCVSWLKAQIG